MEDWPMTEPPPALDCEPDELAGVEDWPLLGTIFVTDCEAVELAGVEPAGVEDWTGGLSLLGTTADDDDGDSELPGDWATVELPVCDCDKTEDAGAWLVGDWLTVDDVGDAWLFVDCWFPPVDVATDWTLVL